MSGQTRDKAQKVWKDPPKGKESQVSKPHTQTRNTHLSPDSSVPGSEQGQKSKVPWLNPGRWLELCLGRELDLRVRLALCLGRELDLRVPSGRTLIQ